MAEEIIIRFRLEKLTCRCEVALRDHGYVRRGEHGDLCKAGQRLYDAATLAGAKVYQLVNGHLVEFPSHVPEADRAERDFQRHLGHDGELPSGIRDIRRAM